MATYRTTSYGNLSGTTNSKFRAVIEVYADDNGSNGYKVYSRCYLEVTQGNFNGTNANVSWSGSLVSIGGAGKYADTGQVYEGVYSYNSTFTKSISCGYSTSKHNYKSSCSMNWKVPSLPTYYLGIGQRVDNKEGITLGSGYKFRDYGKGNYILLDNQADDGWAIQALYLNKNEYGNKLKYGLYNYSTLGLTKKGYHNNGTWREQKSGRIVGQDEEFTYGSLIDANRGDSVKNRDSISVFDTIWYLNEAYIYMRANGGQLSSTEKWAIDSNGNIYDKNKTSESDAWIIIYTYGDNVDLYNYSTLGLIKKIKWPRSFY